MRAADRQQTTTGQSGIRLFTMWVQFRRRSFTESESHSIVIIECFQLPLAGVLFMRTHDLL